MDVCHCTVAYNFYSVSVASRVFWWLHCNSSQTYETGKITLFIGKKTQILHWKETWLCYRYGTKIHSQGQTLRIKYTCTVNISLCIDCNPYNTHPPQNNAGVRSPRHHMILLSVHSDGPDLVLMLVHRGHTGVGLDDPQLDQAVRSAAENIVSKLICILN